MVLHNVNYSFREISQHASRDGARFLRILRLLPGSNDEFFIDLKASYIQTDRRYCHQSCKLEAEASSLEKYVLQDILSFESPLLPTSLLKLCSQIIWLDYTGAV